MDHSVFLWAVPGPSNAQRGRELPRTPESVSAVQRPRGRLRPDVGDRGADESACKPDPVPGRLAASRSATIHLGLPSPAGSMRSTRRLGRAALERLRSRPARAARPFDLAPGGVYRATPVTRGAGGLLHHRFTLTPRLDERGAVCSLWHCPAGHPGLPLTTTLPCGVRTFLGGSPRGTDAAARPTRPREQCSPQAAAARDGQPARRDGWVPPMNHAVRRPHAVPAHLDATAGASR